MNRKKMNKMGAGVSGGMILLIVGALVAAYMFIPAVQDIFKPAEPSAPIVGRCPSSGLTEVTLNTQEALASSATNSNVSYYIYDSGSLVKEGTTGSDGTVSFDVACGIGQKYTMLVLNEKSTTGVYPQTVIVDASSATDIHNLKTYEFGQMHISNIGSSVDPAETHNVSGGAGKTCGFVITFANNESASGYYKPLIMCEANSTSVSDIFINGVVKADAKKPTRISATSGWAYHVFELDRMLKSTEGAVKLTGTIQFSASNAPTNTDNMSCRIVDQSTFRVAEYKTLSLSEGFLEAAETDSVGQVGAPDSNTFDLHFKGSYC
jgi:hypothetical protein